MFTIKIFYPDCNCPFEELSLQNISKFHDDLNQEQNVKIICQFSHCTDFKTLKQTTYCISPQDVKFFDEKEVERIISRLGDHIRNNYKHVSFVVYAN